MGMRGAEEASGSPIQLPLMIGKRHFLFAVYLFVGRAIPPLVFQPHNNTEQWDTFVGRWPLAIAATSDIGVTNGQVYANASDPAEVFSIVLWLGRHLELLVVRFYKRLCVCARNLVNDEIQRISRFVQ